MRTADDKRYFLDAPQILWLLQHKVVTIEQFEQLFLLDRKTIDDRNKTDGFVRVLAVAQALWFCVDVVARAAQGLAVTMLEITVIGIVVNSVAVYYFWKEKPADVWSVDIIDVPLTVNQLLQLEEDEEVRGQRFYRSPLEFVGASPWWAGLIYRYMINIRRHLLNLLFCRQPRRVARKDEQAHNDGRPIILGRRSENDVLPVRGRAMAINLALACAFLGINFIAWNFQFPTLAERRLWRVCSSVLLAGSLLVPALAEVYSESRVAKMQADVQRRRKALHREMSKLGTSKGGKQKLSLRLRTLTMRLGNNSPNDDPRLDVSPVFAVVMTTAFAICLFARMAILAEDFASFRALPPIAYQTVEWSRFLPHLG